MRRQASTGLVALASLVLALAVAVTAAALLRGYPPSPAPPTYSCEYVDHFNTYRCTDDRDEDD